MNLESIVRLDIRENELGQLQVLEANPKPDLKAPCEQQTSLVCTGLSSHGMSYDDLILTLLADRIDILFCQKRGSAVQIAELLR